MEEPTQKEHRPVAGTPLGSDSDSLTLQVGALSVYNWLHRVLGSSSAALPKGEGAPLTTGSGEQPVRKYQIDSVIGSGGMGTVIKAFDVDLHRWVAMKVVRQEAAGNKDHLSRFVEEAQVCGQLEHPNIPPVHEMGVDPDGQVYFTMKLVKGRTLQEISRDLSLGRPEVRRDFTPIRLAQILQQAAMGVHYANVRGVIHRDLKPENIMVGDYGEVLVMDWGLAKVSGEDTGARLFGEDAVVTARTESGLHTLAGAVQGTPSYMAPEQARGEQEAIDARTDVYGKVVPKRTEIPPDLEAICMKAISPRKEERYADTREFQQDLQSYIEGTRDRERRRGEALALVAEGRKQLSSYLGLEKMRGELKEEARKAGEKIAPYDPLEKKKTLWSIEDSIVKIEREGAQVFSRTRSTLDAAIQTDPACQEARRVLADLYWERFVDAEARHDDQTAALYRGLVEANDDGRYAARLKGDGTMVLRTDPPGAEAVLYRYVEEERILVAREPRSLGMTPLGPVSLPMGSYLIILKLEGFADTRYPVSIGRAEDHAGKVKLRREEEIGSDFVYVPAGEFIRGGDPESYGGIERSRVFVDDFYIGRFPLTMGEYCEFLDSLAAAGGKVEEHLPQQPGERYLELGPGGGYRPADRIVVGETRKRYPPGFEVSCPVMGISWHSALAYARWRSERDGREYGLPTEDAWEKGARGVDGRFHPWGDHFDWTFVKGGLSRSEPAQPEPVGAFPTDESPYGVRDLLGTIREWTQTWYDERAGSRVVRGGAWSLIAPRHFRCATRFGYTASSRSSVVGFRLFSRAPLPRRPAGGTRYPR